MFSPDSTSIAVLAFAPGWKSRADDLAHVLDLLPAHEAFEFVDDIEGCVGIQKCGGADLHGGSAGHEKLRGVFAAHDASATDERNVQRLGHLVHHSQRDWLEGGPRETAGTPSERGTPGFNVDPHCGEGVD